MSLSAILSTSANAQVPPSRALAPPVNHETGRIEEVINAADDGYRFRGYVLTWRSTRVFVAGPSEESHTPGDNLDIVVYRTEIDGHRILRFESNSVPANDEDVDRESANSDAAITMGTARIEDIDSAESDGYRFVGYFVTWHNQRVLVVDPQHATTRTTGESINFRVFHTGLGASRRLSFSL